MIYSKSPAVASCSTPLRLIPPSAAPSNRLLKPYIKERLAEELEDDYDD